MISNRYVRMMTVALLLWNLVLSAAQADSYWQGGSSDFNNPASWNPAGVPATVVNGTTVNINADNDSGSNNVCLIQPGDPVWNPWDIRAGDGVNASGAFLQTGSTNNIGGWFRLADSTGSAGFYTLSNGVVNCALQAHVGEVGNGVLEIDGGIFNVAQNPFCMGDGDFGPSPIGVLKVNGGTINTGPGVELWLGEGHNGGIGGTGKMIMTGGSVNVNSWFAIGRFGGIADLELSGGAITKLNGGGNITVATSPSTAVINQSGGVVTNTVSQTWIAESGIGTWNLSGGWDVFGVVHLTQVAGAQGAFNLNGGDLVATEITDNGGNGTLNFNGGTLHAGASGNLLHNVNGGGIVQAGGARINTEGNNVTISQALVDGGGGLTKLGSGTLTFSGSLLYSGATSVSNGMLMVTAPATFASPVCTVAGGAAFGVTLASANAQLSLATLSLSAAASGLAFNFAGVGGQTNAPLHVNSLAANGPVTVNVAGFNFSTGQFPLLQYNIRTGNGSFSLGSLPVGITAQLVTNTQNSSIDLVITAVHYVAGSVTAGYWPFTNSSNLGMDSSGLGNQLATGSGTPAYSSAGKFGGALYLDGNSTMTTLSGTFPIGVPVNANPYTIAVWEKVDNGCPNNGGFVGWGANATSEGNNLRLNGPNSLYSYWYANDFSVGGLTANPMDGNWHAIAVTWDGTNQILYVDGANVGSQIPAAPNVQSLGFVVGKTTADVNFKGWLEDLLIANAALTPVELAVYQSGNWSASLATYPLLPTAAPSNTVYAGTAVTLNVLVVGTPPYQYQWQKNGTNISWGSASALVLTNVAVADSGNYNVIVSNASGTNTSPALTVTVNPASAPVFTLQPTPASATNYLGGLSTFTAAINGTLPIYLQWYHNGTNIPNANATTLTLGSLQGGSAGSYTLTASNSLGTTNSLPAILTVLPPPNPSALNVLTYHNDNTRQGANTNEVLLTLANVNVSTFGRLLAYPTDGLIIAQPLYVSGLVIPGQGTHDAVIVATENDSVYAFDADSNAGTNGGLLWRTNLGIAVSSFNNEFGNRYQGTYYGDIVPIVGITGTPVIDRTSGTLYVNVHTREAGATTNYYHRIHALNITNGAEQAYSPVTVTNSVPGTGVESSNGVVRFDARVENQRPGMTLAGGMVYTAYGSYADTDPYHGWVLGFNATNLAQSAKYVFNTTPNATVAAFGVNAGEGALWMGGNGLCADASNDLYFITGNGSFSANTNGGDYSDSFVKLSTTNGLAVADYFTPYNQAALAAADTDLGSGGAILLPDSAGSAAHPHLIVGAGKDGILRLVDRDNMGHFNAANDNQIVQEVPGAIGGAWSTPAFFNSHIFYQGSGDVMKSFLITNGVIVPTPTSKATTSFNALGGTPSISANGTNNAIVWTLQSDANSSGGPVVLHAYNATNLAIELYNSSMNLPRDNPGAAIKMTTPTVVNGKVFVGAAYAVSIFGNSFFLATPVIAPAASLFTNSITITLSDATPSSSIYYTLDGTTPTTNSVLYTGPFVLTNSALIQVVATAPGAVNSGVASASFINSAAIGTGTGLLGAYYSNHTSTSPYVGLPTLTRTDAVINFNWNTVGPDPSVGQTTFTARWTGTVQPQFTGPCTFYATADDGVRLWVNGQLLIDEWINQPPTTYQATISLNAQQLYNIRMDYFQGNGGAEAMLSWSSPSTPQAIIPQTQLYPFTNPPPVVVLTGPTNSATNFTAAASVTISAEADAAYNPISFVSFYANGSYLGSVSSVPYTLTATGLGAGNYALTAVAVDGSGLSSTSSPVNITVTNGSGLAYGLTSNATVNAFLNMPTTFNGTLPVLLSGTGAFSNTTNRTPADGLIPYAPNAPQWKDNALSRWFMAVPNNGGIITPGEQIQFQPTNAWTLPAGSVFVKNFDLLVNETNAATRRLETELLVRDINGSVYGVTYKWRPDNSDADLLSGSFSENILITNATGVRTQKWYYPSPSDCQECHNTTVASSPSGINVLGVNARQLNGSLTYPATGITDNQLRTLNRLGLFNPALNEAAIGTYSKLSAMTNLSVSLQERVRSYLDVNCEHCHQPGGQGITWDARYDTPLAQQHITNFPAAFSLGISDGACVVKAKDVWRSVLVSRINTLDQTIQMPDFRDLIDTNAVAVITAWINSLPGTPALAPPAIMPNGGSYFAQVNVALQPPDTNAAVYYTLDGSRPTTNSLKYTGAFNLLSNVTVSAFAVETNFNNSIAVSALFLVQPLYFTAAGFLTNHQLQLGFVGVPGSNYVLQATTNFTTWTPLTTNTAATNTFNFLDPRATNFPFRFYRVLQQ